MGQQQQLQATNLTEAERLNKLGRSRKMAGDLIGAIHAFRKSIGVDAKQPLVFHELGSGLFELGDSRGAIDALYQAATMQTGFIQAWYDLAVAFRSAGEGDCADMALRIATAILLIELDSEAEAQQPSIGGPWPVSEPIDASSWGIPSTRSPDTTGVAGASGTSGTVASWIFKLIVAGPAESNKTALIQRFCTNSFITDHKMTIGAAFSLKDITFENGISIKVQIWDFATEERFRFLLGDYCRGASGALICFDVTDYETFKQVPGWIEIIRKEARDVPIMLVGTKYDLPNHQVPYDLAAQYAQDAGCIGVAYCSSATADNVEEAFECIAKWMVYHTVTAQDS
jgi:small GTP-binding protein